MSEQDTLELMVSIRCFVYNHEPYLRQCLDGFVMQRTNFRFEAIVHDDASTDGSAAIIREYAAKYPDIIKPIYETENQYSKRDGSLRRIMDAHMRGKYVAYCEGDDYWTDPLKLQKQVDFLETHPDFSLCTHHFRSYCQNTKELAPDWVGYKKEDFEFDLLYFVSRKAWVTQPLTFLYRRSAYVFEEFKQYKLSKDVTLVYHLLKRGKGMLLKDDMGVYRLHDGGVWMGVKKEQRITAEIKYALAIYEVEKSREAAMFIRGSIYGFGYIGLKYLLRHYKPYFNAIRIVMTELGIKVTMKIIFRSFNIFHKHFGY